MKNKLALVCTVLLASILVNNCDIKKETPVVETTPTIENYQNPSDYSSQVDTLSYDYFVRRREYLERYWKRASEERLTEMRDLMWIDGIDTCFIYNWRGRYNADEQKPII